MEFTDPFFFHSLHVWIDANRHTKTTEFALIPPPFGRCHLVHLADSRSDPAAPSDAVVCDLLLDPVTH